MLDIREPIRLVIWDLDDTFWRGILSEGGIREHIEDNVALVPTLASRGILSSICSKNELGEARHALQGRGVWDYFVFVSIDWTPKGHRVARIVEDIGLRPSSVLFIDDSPMNRAEVSAALPGIHVVDESFARSMRDHAMFVGKNDVQLTRLRQYRLLENKRAARASGDNIAFLQQCNIHARIIYDVEPHIERIIELISRTNQLNFTKRHLDSDPLAARAGVLNEIRFFGHQAGLVAVCDKFGDYGLVGYFLKTLDEGMSAGSLKHFCFSCRTLGMGIERWTYEKLGCPRLEVADAVVVDLRQGPAPYWINNVVDSRVERQTASRFAEIRLRGGCEIAAMAHYFKVAGVVTCVETNAARGAFVTKRDDTTSLVNILDPDPRVQRAITMLPGSGDTLESSFLKSTSGSCLLVLNVWGELHLPRYRHKLGFHVHVVVSDFMAWGESHAGGDLAAWSDEALHAQADSSGMLPGDRQTLIDLVETLRRDYVFAGPIDEEGLRQNLQIIVRALPPASRLVLILPSDFQFDGAQNTRNREHSRWCRRTFGGMDNVMLFPIDDFIAAHFERSAQYGDHFDRIVYYRLADRILRDVSPLD